MGKPSSSSSQQPAPYLPPNPNPNLTLTLTQPVPYLPPNATPEHRAIREERFVCSLEGRVRACEEAQSALLAHLQTLSDGAYMSAYGHTPQAAEVMRAALAEAQGGLEQETIRREMLAQSLLITQQMLTAESEQILKIQGERVREGEARERETQVSGSQGKGRGGFFWT